MLFFLTLNKKKREKETPNKRV